MESNKNLFLEQKDWQNLSLDELLLSIKDLIKEKSLERAEEICGYILEKFPEDFRVFNELGTIYFLNEELFESQIFFEKALNSGIKETSSLKLLAELYTQTGNYSLALDTYLQILVISPFEQDILPLLGAISDKFNANDIKKLELFNEFNSMQPKLFTIETALACNLKCPECAIGSDIISSRNKGYLKFDKFKIIADKIRNHAEFLYLHLWGEPTLNKEIIPMVQYASEFCKTNISTNATMLDEQKAKELINSGVNDIIVSIDGNTQEVYEKYRVGGNVNDAKRGLEHLAKYNRMINNKVIITPQFIVFKHNQHEIEDFQKYCHSLGMHPFFKSPYIRNKESVFEVSDYEQFHRKTFPTVESLKKEMSSCTNPKDVFTINIDGSVIICCHDYDKVTNFGNIFEQSVEEIWNSSAYRDFRWQILKGDAPEFCIKSCMSFTLEHNGSNKTKSVKSRPEPQNKLAKINLCSGSIKLDDYLNIDICAGSDIILDLEKELLPIPDNSVDVVVCISAINYFTPQRGLEIIKDVFRVLKPGGVARFGTQDLKIITDHYLNRNKEFYFQKNAQGTDRFKGRTFGEKLNEWFYGYITDGKGCKYVYDYETLSLLFEEAGFSIIEEKRYLDSRIEGIDKIDNRPEQMFFLEAVKTIKAEVPEDKKLNLTKHLAYSLKWLQRAQDVTEDDGVAAVYYLDKSKWHTSYPETTGYIITTFLNAYKLLGIKELLERAIKMGDWEISIQQPNGGIGEPVNAPQMAPRVFNTAQVISGFISLYQFTSEERFINAAIKAADWILTVQNKDGSWTDSTHDGPNCVHALTASQLLLLSKITSNKNYYASALRFTNWALSNALSNGWFKNSSICTPPDKPWTHFIGYVLEGLLEISLMIDEPILSSKIINVISTAADNLCKVYPIYRNNVIGLPGTLDNNWVSSDTYTCVTGNIQIAIFLKELSKINFKEEYLQLSEKLLNDSIALHLIDDIKDENIIGGLPGSYPVEGGYCTYQIPNWGVKYFADLIMIYINDNNLELLPVREF